MDPHDRLLEAFKAELERAKKMTREEARAELIKGGFLDRDGRLAARYGGGQSEATWPDSIIYNKISDDKIPLQKEKKSFGRKY